MCRGKKAAVLGRASKVTAARQRKRERKASHVTLGGLSVRTEFGRQLALRQLDTFFFSRPDDFSDLDTTTPANTVKMAPKKAAVRAPQENISLGPQVREGKTPRTRQLCDNTRSRKSTFDAEVAKTRTSR